MLGALESLLKNLNEIYEDDENFMELLDVFYIVYLKNNEIPLQQYIEPKILNDMSKLSDRLCSSLLLYSTTNQHIETSQQLENRLCDKIVEEAYLVYIHEFKVLEPNPEFLQETETFFSVIRKFKGNYTFSLLRGLDIFFVETFDNLLETILKELLQDTTNFTTNAILIELYLHNHKHMNSLDIAKLKRLSALNTEQAIVFFKVFNNLYKTLNYDPNPR